MTVRDIENILWAWAPREIAWERDNVGLQCGSHRDRVRGILVCLDANVAVARQASRRGADLIVSHHPPLFRPLTSLTPDSRAGALARELVERRVALIAMHTNLDFARGGTSFALAGVLGLERPEFLSMPYRLQRKIVTYVPPSHADRVASAMSAEGAGVIGNYDHCSFRMVGTGSFRGTPESHPHLGQPGKLEHVEEVRLEMIAPHHRVDRIVQAMKQAHPYEEVAYEVYATENRSSDYGMGVVGTLVRPVRLGRFLSRVRGALRVPHLRYTGDPRRRIRRVAACGGSGADLLQAAIERGADAFVTADVKYHHFQESEGRIALVDAGHYETEAPVVGAVVAHLRRELAQRGSTLRVTSTSMVTHGIQYV